MKKILMAEFLEYNSNFMVGSHHFAKQFAENGYEVLWLSPIYNNMYYFKDKPIYEQRKALHKTSFVKLDYNILGYSPYSPILYGSVPMLDSKLASKLSIELTMPNLYTVLNKNGFNAVDILWLTNPKYFYLIDKVKYKKLLYRCADDISGFKESCKTITYFEEQLIQRADKVFVTSISLIEKKGYIRDDLIYLPNAVEINNFFRDSYVLPEEYEDNVRKKCIYVGAIDQWFDIFLIQYCSEKLKNVDFYLIGPEKIDLSVLKNYKNVFVLGKKDYKDIPNYLYYSHAAIIPFCINTLTDSITPIKLYEYMSVGLNVVTTNFKEMQYIDSPAFIAKNYKEFCSYIEKGIECKEENKERNIKFARENTWEKRFQKVVEENRR